MSEQPISPRAARELRKSIDQYLLPAFHADTIELVNAGFFKKNGNGQLYVTMDGRAYDASRPSVRKVSGRLKFVEVV